MTHFTNLNLILFFQREGRFVGAVRVAVHRGRPQTERGGDPQGPLDKVRAQLLHQVNLLLLDNRKLGIENYDQTFFFLMIKN